MRNGKLTTIIFIRDKNAKGQEVSGYIDYGHRQVALAASSFCFKLHNKVSSQQLWSEHCTLMLYVLMVVITAIMGRLLTL